MQSGKNTISLDLSPEQTLELAKTTYFLDGYARGVQAAVDAMKNHMIQGLLAKQQNDAPSAPLNPTA
jgi:hypothetical protein